MKCLTGIRIPRCAACGQDATQTLGGKTYCPKCAPRESGPLILPVPAAGGAA